MKQILLSAIGSHPQLITETLYGLYAAGKPHPDEIYVITTLDSVNKLKQGLLADGQLAKFEAHYSRPAAIFNDNHIWVIEDSVGRPAFDAKNAQDQIAMADFITRKVYALTSRDDVAVHASVSGGRKTMAFYLGYAMSLLGRKQDELSHVFVNSVFEDVEDFWFPTRHSQEIETGKLRSRLDCKNAQVILAQIPFVRMRRSVNPQLISSLQNLSFSDVVSALERANDTDVMVKLHRPQRCISVIDAKVSLTPKEFAFYEWILGLASEGLVIDRAFESNVENSKSFLNQYRYVGNDVRIYQTFGIEPEDFARGALSQLKGMNREFVQTLSSSINRKFKNKLPIELVDKLSVKTIAVPANTAGSNTRYYVAISEFTYQIISV